MLAKVEEGRIELHMNTRLVEITDETVILECIGEVEPQRRGERFARTNDHVFEMIGAELPLKFFDKVGIRLQSHWSFGTKIGLALVMAAVYMLYAVKNSGLWFPFTVIGAEGRRSGAVGPCSTP